MKNLTASEKHTRNIWLFSFNFAGMRVSDVLRAKWSDINDNRLHYIMHKYSKLLSLKISEKILFVLKNYAGDRTHEKDFIFPELKTANKKFNSHLKTICVKAKIDKKVTMHIARHSFGNIAGDSIHRLMLQKLYRHSDLKTTLNYQANFIHKDTDEALDSVLNF